MSMEFNTHIKRGSVAVSLAMILSLSVTSLEADTYRWKDKDGNVHYGATVPAEYADQPYDILNNAGLLIEHVEDTSEPVEIVEEEEKVVGRQPLISEEVRRAQSDKLLVIQYLSEEAIHEALALEIAQLGYDSRLIDQSYESTSTAIRDQIRQAADQQRAGQKISKDQQKGIAKLYARHSMDAKRRLAVQKREDRIRTRFQADLERYRFLTSEKNEVDEEQADQG
jgi:hypothetical protein